MFKLRSLTDSLSQKLQLRARVLEMRLFFPERENNHNENGGKATLFTTFLISDDNLLIVISTVRIEDFFQYFTR